MQLDVQVNIQYTLYIVRYVNNNNNNNNNGLFYSISPIESSSPLED